MHAMHVLYRRGYLDLQVPSRAMGEVEHYISHRLFIWACLSLRQARRPPYSRCRPTWNPRRGSHTVKTVYKPTKYLLRPRTRRRSIVGNAAAFSLCTRLLERRRGFEGPTMDASLGGFKLWLRGVKH
jgi:hypothetical protein